MQESLEKLLQSYIDSYFAQSPQNEQADQAAEGGNYHHVQEEEEEDIDIDEFVDDDNPPEEKDNDSDSFDGIEESKRESQANSPTKKKKRDTTKKKKTCSEWTNSTTQSIFCISMPLLTDFRTTFLCKHFFAINMFMSFVSTTPSSRLRAPHIHLRTDELFSATTRLKRQGNGLALSRVKEHISMKNSG